ncbi:MAG: response regulator [Bacteroidales bacterium]|nr:response regulator [Bacteroidales bacterium]
MNKIFQFRNKMRMSINTKLMLYILSSVLIIFSVVTGYVIYHNASESMEQAKSLAESRAYYRANQTKSILEVYIDASRTIAQTFEDFESIPEADRRKTYMSLIKKVLESNEEFLSIWTIWEPNSIDRLDAQHIMGEGSTRIGNFSPTYYKVDKVIKLEVSPPNATLFEGDYYNIPKSSLKETILNPYYYSYTGNKNDEILQTNLITPIIKDGKFMGVVGIDASLNVLQEKIRDYKPFETGHVMLVSSNGIIVASKDKQLVGKNISEYNQKGNIDLEMEINFEKGLAFSGELFDPVTQKDAYVSFVPITIGNCPNSWSAGVIVPLDTLSANTRITIIQTILFGIIGLLLMLVLITLISRRITNPLKKATKVLEHLSKGIIEENIGLEKTNDELGTMARAIEKLSHSLHLSSRFARAVGQGKLDEHYTPLSQRDELGNALLGMRNNLKILSKVNLDNSWTQQSIVEINELLRGDKSPIDLANSLLSKLAGITGAKAGACYLIDDNQIFKLTGTFAFSKRKSHSSEFAMGEGLVGQAAMEQKMILFENVPKNFIYIQSGLSEGDAPSVVLLPFIFQNKVIGVLELAFIQEPEELCKTLLEHIAESIAIAFNSIITRSEMLKLLVRTQEQSEELRVQQEELREANEELEQQTKALKESEAGLQAQQEELRVTNEELEEKTQLLEQQKKNIAVKNEELTVAKIEVENKAVEVERASKYKSEFLANMSHELRTPLNSLLILSRSLADNKKQNLLKDQVEAAEIIYNSGNELLTLINDILDLSKIESGKLDINFEPVVVDSISEYIHMHFNHMVRQKNLQFNIEISDDCPDNISTDRQRVEQILKNLLSNAIKFTHQGSITLELSRTPSDTKYFNAELQGKDSISIAVADTGIGIPPNKQKDIFEAFKQADGSTSRKYGGTGLGLSISKELARLLGGEIHLKSESGKGSTFTLILPLTVSEVENVRTQPLGNLNPVKSTSAKILEVVPAANVQVVPSIPDDRKNCQPHEKILLIIEDDINFAKIIADQARDKGFKILASSTGEEGIKLADKFKPSAIVLDINLPGMDGWEVLDLIKNNPDTRHIPVHMMSGYEETIDAYKKGAIGYLTKPVNSEALDSAFNCITNHLAKSMKDLLLVEDDDNLRTSIKTIIGDKDLLITDASTGAMAFELIKEKTFDCMVLDLGLPDMSGFDLLKQLHSNKSIKTPPIIVYTGRELTRDEDRELHKYTNSIIIKGVKSEERLLDETALFLHRVVSEMPKQQQDIISFLHDKDTIFRGKKLLVVDDDMRNVIALTHVLEEKDIIVKAAENGQIAIDTLNNEPDIQLVLMDIMMPVMDGYETIGKIREDKRFKNLPIIALTAKAMKEDRNKCISAGASDYIAKPVNVEKLMSLIRVWLHK